MTWDEFEAKWGDQGEMPSGRKWKWTVSFGGLVITDNIGSCAVITNIPSSADVFLTAEGCKPVDKIAEVLEKYGWAKDSDGDWNIVVGDENHYVFFVKENNRLGGTWNIHITTPEKAEMLCKLLDLKPRAKSNA